MDNLARLLLRFVLVPLGYVCGGAAGLLALAFVSHARSPDIPALPVVFFVSVMSLVVAVQLSAVGLVAFVGILYAERFAIRGWQFHMGNGFVSAWLMAAGLHVAGWFAISAQSLLPVSVAGLAAGLIYWRIAGSTAGYFRPMSRSAARRAAAVTPVSPPVP